MPSNRTAGVLLHVTSLPGDFGIGDLGPEAHRWVDVLTDAGQQRWQILPLGPTGPGGGPYGCLSAFAGNPLLVSPELLRADGLLDKSDLADARLPGGPVRFDRVERVKDRMFLKAWSRYRKRDSSAFERFIAEQKTWLTDYALFVALGRRLKSFDWSRWDTGLARRKPAAIGSAILELQDEIRLEQYKQFLFDRQWRAVRRYANERGVKIIGDVPIFVSGNSADVWVNPGQFLLDRNLQPKVVSGVPPDYFSTDGQRWGNPLYHWAAMEQDGFGWWIERIRSLIEQADIVRIDHFRGLAACWHIPAGEKTARHGKWIKSPGEKLLAAAGKALGTLPLIAEDLGLITPDVEALRDRFGLPGMRVLQFGFDTTADDPFLPHNFVRNCVAYTGTHDNDTTVGWFRSLKTAQRKRAATYLPGLADDPAFAAIRAVLGSVADTAIIPAQDVLALGTRDRMNRPGDGAGNWRWRLDPGYHRSTQWKRLAESTAIYGRADH
jgi:4-alpha-glucanotransferase